MELDSIQRQAIPIFDEIILECAMWKSNGIDMPENRFDEYWNRLLALKEQDTQISNKQND